MKNQFIEKKWIENSYFEHLNASLIYLSKIQKYCEDIVKKAYQAKKIPITFPINIFEIAKFMDIEIEEGVLNYKSDSCIDWCYAKLFYEEKEGQVKRKIIIDGTKCEPISDLERYEIAYEIAKALLYPMPNKDEIDIANLMMPSSFRRGGGLDTCFDGIWYSLAAIFLLVPLEKFVKILFDFTEKHKNAPWNFSNYIRFLSKKFEIPSDILGINYFGLKACVDFYIHQDEVWENLNSDQKKRILNIIK